MATIRVDVSGLTQADLALGRFAATVENWAPFWAKLAESLSDTAQTRWPLRKRSGRLRKSLVWTGQKLGKGGVFESSPDKLRFGTTVFYSQFSQYGTRNQRARPLIHVDEAQHAEQLTTWLQTRARAAGIEVT